MCLTAASSTTVGVLWVCDCNGEEDEEFEEHNCVEGNEAQRPSHCAPIVCAQSSITVMS